MLLWINKIRAFPFIQIAFSFNNLWFRCPIIRFGFLEVSFHFNSLVFHFLWIAVPFFSKWKMCRAWHLLGSRLLRQKIVNLLIERKDDVLRTKKTKKNLLTFSIVFLLLQRFHLQKWFLLFSHFVLEQILMYIDYTCFTMFSSAKLTQTVESYKDYFWCPCENSFMKTK